MAKTNGTVLVTFAQLLHTMISKNMSLLPWSLRDSWIVILRVGFAFRSVFAEEGSCCNFSSSSFNSREESIIVEWKTGAVFFFKCSGGEIQNQLSSIELANCDHTLTGLRVRFEGPGG